jgi:hypothetical protein
MRNPNNNLIPNLYDEDECSCTQWVDKAKRAGIYQYLADPMSHVDKGLTPAEAVFIDNLKARIEKVLGRSIAPTVEDVIKAAAENYGYSGLFGHRESLAEAGEYAMRLIDNLKPSERKWATIAMMVVSNTHAVERAKERVAG